MANKNNSGLWTDSFGGVGAFLSALEKQGVTLAHLSEVRANQALAQKMAQAIMSASLKSNSGRKLLQEVLNSPCPFYSGKKKKDTHFAFMGIHVNLLELQNKFPKEKQPRFYKYSPEAWYSEQGFALSEYCEVKQYLLLRGAIPGSTGLEYDDQIQLLPAGYQPPLAVEEALKDMLYYRKYKAFLNPTVWARTRSFTSDGKHVSVGSCDSGGLSVYGWYDDDAYSDFGLGASWDFNS